MYGYRKAAKGDGMDSAATVGKPEGLPASLPRPWDSGPWMPLEHRRSQDRAIGSAKYSLYPYLRRAWVTLAPRPFSLQSHPLSTASSSLVTGWATEAVRALVRGLC